MCLQWDTNSCSCPCASSQGEHRESSLPNLPLPSSHNCFSGYCPSWEAASLLPHSFWRSPSLTSVLLASKTLQEHLFCCGILGFFYHSQHFSCLCTKYWARGKLQIVYFYHLLLCFHQWGRAMVVVVSWQVVVLLSLRWAAPPECSYFVLVLVGDSTCPACQGCLTSRTHHPVLLTKEGSEFTSAPKSLKDCGF